MSASEPQVYVNGAWFPESKAQVHLFDSGLMFGEILTETIRTFRGMPYCLTEHLDRLRRSLRVARVELPLSDDELSELVSELVDRNAPVQDPADELLIKVDVTRGMFFYYRKAGVDYANYSLFLHTIRLPFEKFADQYQLGAHAVVPQTRALPAAVLDPRVKHRNRLYQAIAQMEAADVDPEAVPVFVDMDGYIAESSGANVFVVQAGELITPTTDNCLEGISRQTVLRLADELGISALERRVLPYDLITADEAFFTATSYCMLPISSVNGHTIGGQCPGEVFTRVMQAWGEEVGTDIIEQARSRASLNSGARR